MKAFEIQTFAGGKWRIDSVFDDRDLALFEARRIDQGSRHAGVRVVEETFDESSQMTTTRTIFRGGSAERQNKAERSAGGPTGRAQARRKGAGSREPGKRGKKPPPPQAKSGFTKPILILSAIVVIGLGALFGLQELWNTF